MARRNYELPKNDSETLFQILWQLDRIRVTLIYVLWTLILSAITAVFLYVTR